MADGDKARVRWPHRVGPVVPSDSPRYIGSGEAASYRRLPPPEPPKALSWHVPLPVLMGPLWNRLLTGAVPFSEAVRGQVEGGSVQDVGLGDLDGVQAEEAHGLDQDRRARDDCGGAVGVEAGDVFSLVEGDGGELAEDARGGFQQQVVAVDLLRVVGVELLVDRGQRGGGAGDGDARPHRRLDVVRG